MENDRQVVGEPRFVVLEVFFAEHFSFSNKLRWLNSMDLVSLFMGKEANLHQLKELRYTSNMIDKCDNSIYSN